MSFIRTAIRSGLALKAARLVQREMSKPENQRKAKELLGKVAQRRRSAVTDPLPAECAECGADVASPRRGDASPHPSRGGSR